MVVDLLKSILHNIGVLIVGLGVAYLGRMVDSLLGISAFASPVVKAAGVLLLALGFPRTRMGDSLFLREQNAGDLTRTPTYTYHVRPVSLFEESPLSRRKRIHFFGAGLFLGSPTAVIVTALHIPLIDLFIRREEKQLEREFGGEWRRYKNQVRRWF